MTTRQQRRPATFQSFLRLSTHVIVAWIAYRQTKIEDKLNRLLEASAQDARRDLQIGEAIMASIDDVIAKATEAKTVSESTNIAVREVIRLLRESAADPAKMAEAVALLEAIRADDASMLTDNTPLDPSAN